MTATMFSFTYTEKDEQMNNQQEKKLFAFKLAEKKTETQAKPEAQWKARDGVAAAGCSFPSERYSVGAGGDSGVYC
ncbi:hypothetical protein D3C87_2105430 [compost metagenome]